MSPNLLFSLFVRYHLVLQETNEDRRTVANNLASVFTTATNQLTITEVNNAVSMPFTAGEIKICISGCLCNKASL